MTSDEYHQLMRDAQTELRKLRRMFRMLAALPLVGALALIVFAAMR